MNSHYSISARANLSASLWLLWLFQLGACSVNSEGNSAARPSRGAPGATSGSQADSQDGDQSATGSMSGGSSSHGTGQLVVPTSAATSAGAAGTDMTMGTVTPNVDSREPIAVDACGNDNPAGVSADDVERLKQASDPGALRLLYPYEGTVFPRGMLAPDLMWSGAEATAVYVHIKSRIFEYWGCLMPVAPDRLTLPQDVWDAAGHRTFGRDEVFTLELSVLGAGGAQGPVTLHFQIAQATLKGSIYYNSYSSSLGSGAAAPSGGFPGGGFPGVGGAGPGGQNGLVLRIPAGGQAELFGETGCNGCHSVSANGARLLSQFVGEGGGSYDLATGQAPMRVGAGPSGAFGALYPDGTVYLAGSTVIDVARASLTSAGAMSPDATLFDAASGQVVAGQGIPTGALMPMFSPDGKYLVFNDYAISQAHGLAVMSYEVTTHTASDYRVLYEEPEGAVRPAWPFVLPDNHGLIFVRTDGPDFSGNGAGVSLGGGFGVPAGTLGGAGAPYSELFIADVESGTTTLLARAMGYDTPDDAASGATYLPFGAEELQHNYFPTVSPVAAGGYFWVFFDSVRHYGSLGSGRQLWGAAVDISPDGHYTTDLSHPAFYLPGQEFGTGNHRAFAALDPCRKDGDSCSSGIDCCGGFCYFTAPEELVEPTGSCTPPKMNECAKLDERCTRDVDCCLPLPGDPPLSCIGGFCALVPQPD